MKSVGEVMGIGRSFQEALHKATQSLEIKRNGLGADGKGYRNYEQIIEKLTHASWDRVFVIYDAIAMGYSFEQHS
jgi:carbamoyl-phosphate synthase large subunit